MSDKPVRVKLSRAKGWRMPENTVKVDRTTKWGNPFVVGKPGGAFTAKVQNNRHAWQLYRSVAPDNAALVEAARCAGRILPAGARKTIPTKTAAMRPSCW